MARRVGFGGSEKPEKRKERAARNRRHSSESAADLTELAERSLPKAGRLIGGGFLSLWLIGWSAGIVFATLMFFSSWRDGDTAAAAFLLIWVTFAIVGWVFAVKALKKIIRGEPMRFRGRAGRSLLRPPRIGRKSNEIK